MHEHVKSTDTGAQCSSSLKYIEVMSRHLQVERRAHYRHTNLVMMSSTQVTRIARPSPLNIEQRYIASYKTGLDLYTAGMRGVIYHCQIRCLTSLAETAVSLGAHQRGVGGREVAAAQPKSVLPHSPDVLNTHPPISSYSPIPLRDQLRGTE